MQEEDSRIVRVVGPSGLVWYEVRDETGNHMGSTDTLADAIAMLAEECGVSLSGQTIDGTPTGTTQ